LSAPQVLTLIIIGNFASAHQVLTLIIIGNFAFAPQVFIKIKFKFLVSILIYHKAKNLSLRLYPTKKQ